MAEFYRKKQTISFVVDEYGSIAGLVSLDDILKEMLHEILPQISKIPVGIVIENEHSYLIDGKLPLRVINRALGLQFPLKGPKTLSGLIIEYLETIPPSNVCIRLAGYALEILQIKNNRIKTVRIIKTLL